MHVNVCTYLQLYIVNITLYLYINMYMYVCIFVNQGQFLTQADLELHMQPSTILNFLSLSSTSGTWGSQAFDTHLVYKVLRIEPKGFMYDSQVLYHLRHLGQCDHICKGAMSYPYLTNISRNNNTQNFERTLSQVVFQNAFHTLITSSLQ